MIDYINYPLLFIKSEILASAQQATPHSQHLIDGVQEKQAIIFIYHRETCNSIMLMQPRGANLLETYRSTSNRSKPDKQATR
jgi:hypothetical protein